MSKYTGSYINGFIKLVKMIFLLTLLISFIIFVSSINNYDDTQYVFDKIEFEHIYQMPLITKTGYDQYLQYQGGKGQKWNELLNNYTQRVIYKWKGGLQYNRKKDVEKICNSKDHQGFPYCIWCISKTFEAHLWSMHRTIMHHFNLADEIDIINPIWFSHSYYTLNNDTFDENSSDYYNGNKDGLQKYCMLGNIHESTYFYAVAMMPMQATLHYIFIDELSRTRFSNKSIEKLETIANTLLKKFTFSKFTTLKQYFESVKGGQNSIHDCSLIHLIWTDFNAVNVGNPLLLTEQLSSGFNEYSHSRIQIVIDYHGVNPISNYIQEYTRNDHSNDDTTYENIEFIANKVYVDFWGTWFSGTKILNTVNKIYTNGTLLHLSCPSSELYNIELDFPVHSIIGHYENVDRARIELDIHHYSEIEIKEIEKLREKERKISDRIYYETESAGSRQILTDPVKIISIMAIIFDGEDYIQYQFKNTFRYVDVYLISVRNTSIIYKSLKSFEPYLDKIKFIVAECPRKYMSIVEDQYVIFDDINDYKQYHYAEIYADSDFELETGKAKSAYQDSCRRDLAASYLSETYQDNERFVLSVVNSNEFINTEVIKLLKSSDAYNSLFDPIYYELEAFKVLGSSVKKVSKWTYPFAINDQGLKLDRLSSMRDYRFDRRAVQGGGFYCSNCDRQEVFDLLESDTAKITVSERSPMQKKTIIIITFQEIWFYETAKGLHQALVHAGISPIDIYILEELDLTLIQNLKHSNHMHDHIRFLQIAIGCHRPCLLLPSYSYLTHSSRYIIFHTENLFEQFIWLPSYSKILTAAAGIFVYSENQKSYLKSLRPLYPNPYNESVDKYDGSNIINIAKVPMYSKSILEPKIFDFLNDSEGMQIFENDIAGFSTASGSERRLHFEKYFLQRGLQDNIKILGFLKNEDLTWSPHDLYMKEFLFRTSKVVINVHQRKESLLEVHRINYLLSLGKCIVSERSESQLNDELEDEYEDTLIFIPFDDVERMYEKAKEIVLDDKLRKECERRSKYKYLDIMSDTKELEKLVLQF